MNIRKILFSMPCSVHVHSKTWLILNMKVYCKYSLLQVSGLHPTLYNGLLLISLLLDDKDRNRIRNFRQDLSSRWQSFRVSMRIFISLSLLRLLLPGCHHNRYRDTSSMFMIWDSWHPPGWSSHSVTGHSAGGTTHTNLIYSTYCTVLHPHHLS